MANQDFEQFKAEIKAWLDTHPDEYDRFVSGLMTSLHPVCSRYSNWG